MTIAGRLNRLNGWQRLWVLASVLYMIAVSVVVVAVFPTQAEVMERWRSEQIAEAQRRRLSEEEAMECLRSQGLVPNDDGVLPEEKESFDEFFKSKGLSDEHGQLQRLTYMQLALVVDTSVNKRNEEILASLGAVQLRLVAAAVSLWLVPCLALYALGWSIGWVSHGFRKPSPS